MPGPDAKLRLENLEVREVPAVFTVNGLADAVSANGELTLREAISLNTGGLPFNQLSTVEKAQVSGTIGVNDQIQFATGGTIVLTSDLPTLTKKLAISGPGADQLALDGNHLHRPFSVAATGA